MDQAYAQAYAALEQNHWWFRARRIILKDFLEREVGWRAGLRVLEVGVGPGLNLCSLYPDNCLLHGLEPDPENAAIASGRGAAPVHVGTVEQMPPPLSHMSFDLITMFDVLEHLRDDLAGLHKIKERLCQGGRLVLSVPAHQWLWSRHDEINHHFRRYSRPQLAKVLRAAGFVVQRCTYFNSLLLPLVIGSRLLERCVPSKTGAASDFEKSAGLADALLYRIFSAENHWLKRHNFATGVSLLAAAHLPAP